MGRRRETGALTLVEPVDVPHELTTPPRLAELFASAPSTRLWPAVAVGGFIGLAVGLLAIVGATLWSEGVAIAVVGVVLTAALVAADLGNRDRDPRVQLAVAWWIVVFLTLLPPWDESWVERSGVLLPSVCGLSLVLWVRRETVGRALARHADVMEEVARLDATARRAVHSETRVTKVRRIPRLGSIIEGTVVYEDEAGTTRTVPLSTGPASSHLMMPLGGVMSEQPESVVWHTPDHRVLLTKVLAG